ncbi:MAG: hypothetical protein LBK73_02535 [Treponema sp.]|jgi:hypothetical protein|nr:hypothetical protein [Treponema sp.]
MAKKIFVAMMFAAIVANGVSAVDFGKINSTLGPRSFSADIYGGFALNNVGANFEWGLGGLPLTLGLGFSPILVGEYALRVGYHPDLGVKGLDVYANVTLGIWNAFFFPLFVPQVGVHIGVRYYFGEVFGIFGEGGWSFNANYVKAGISFKKR